MTSPEKISKGSLLKTIGPGILFAGAAIGGSHLIQSTRAGADYGYELIWVVVLVNLFKYPFFEFGHRYTTATGKSLIEGYAELGRWAVVTFFILSLLTATVNVAAVTIVAAGLTGHLFGLSWSAFQVSILLAVLSMVLLFIGKYPLLDKAVKIMIFILAVSTTVAVFLALGSSRQMAEAISVPDIWTGGGIAFLIALMGWMPAPIESSVWPSLWLLQRRKQTKYIPNLKEALVDFHIGYIGTAVLAVFFVLLGALVMFGSGEKFSPNGVIFSQQLVALYTKTLGSWSFWIISITAFMTMLSTTLTVIDAYPRSLDVSMKEIFPKTKQAGERSYWIWVTLNVILALIIIGFLTANMRQLLDFATILSFLAAPVFAFINYKVVTGKNIEAGFKPKRWLISLSWIGIVFLVLFSLIYLYSILFL